MLSALLGFARARIHPDSRALGPYLRFPLRIGNAVTQEEVAETVGATRQWYALLEAGREVRASRPMLGRIADALMLDDAERSSLFEFAVPELGATKLRAQSLSLLEAFGSMQSLTRRLWTASTEDEALTVVREHCLIQFAPEVMGSHIRLGQGQWAGVMVGNAKARRPLEAFEALMRTEWPPEVRDEMYGYPFRSQVHGVETWDELPTPSHDFVTRYSEALDNIGLAGDFDFIRASVQTRSGLVFQLGYACGTRHFYSELERALLSAIADLSSLALSS